MGRLHVHPVIEHLLKIKRPCFSQGQHGSGGARSFGIGNMRAVLLLQFESHGYTGVDRDLARGECAVEIRRGAGCVLHDILRHSRVA